MKKEVKEETTTTTETTTETETENKEESTMKKEVKEVKRIADVASLEEACMNGSLQAIGKTVTGWKVTTYTDGSTDKEEIKYTVRARDVLDKEKMPLFRKGIKDIVECRTQEGIRSLLDLFGVAMDNAEQANRYIDKLFMTTLKSSNGIATRTNTYKEDSVIPILQMAARNEFPTSRFIRKPREQKYTEEDLRKMFEI